MFSSLFNRMVWSFFTCKSGNSAYVHFLNVFLVLFRVPICEYEIQREVNIETISATTYVNSVYILAASKYHVCGQADGEDSAAFYTSTGAGLRTEPGRGRAGLPGWRLGSVWNIQLGYLNVTCTVRENCLLVSPFPSQICFSWKST